MEGARKGDREGSRRENIWVTSTDRVSWSDSDFPINKSVRFKHVAASRLQKAYKQQALNYRI